MIALRPFLALALSTSLPGGSPFNGTWLMDVDSIRGPTQTQTLSLRNGVFSRGDPASTVRVKADGLFHAIPSDGYVDAVAVIVVSPREVREINRLRGKMIYSIVYRISADGAVLSQQIIDYSKRDHKPIPTTIVYRRDGRPTRGVSQISGAWKTVKVATTRDHLAESLQLSGRRLSSSGPGGYGFDAEIGGPPVPIRGDADTGRVSVEMPNEHIIVEHLSLNGAATVDVTMTLRPDGRTIQVSATRRKDKSISSWVLHRQ
jgi:hypothetical protein